MWGSVVVFLCVAIASSEAEKGFPRLPAPTNLRLDRRTENHQELLEIHWNFVNPPNVTLRRIEFAIVLQTPNEQERKLYFKTNDGPFSYKIRGLLPGTKYSVNVRATSPNWEDSENSTKYFVTAPADSLPLTPPWGLRIHRSTEEIDKVPETFVVEWNFEKPPHLKFEDIQFVLSLQAEGKPRLRLFAQFSGPPFKYTLRNLPLGTRYSLKIGATCEQCKDQESLVEQFQTRPFAFSQLEAPYDISLHQKILNAEESVVVEWNFDKPLNLTLSRTEFVLLLEGQGQGIKKFYVQSSRFPFTYTLRGLSPDTKYLLKLMATSPNWQQSEASYADFVSFPIDWPAPTITSVSSVMSDNFVEYFLQWELEPKMNVINSLHHFAVRVCDRNCFSYWWNITEARVPVEFNSEVSITIAAFFDARGPKLIESESKPYTGRSAKGQPGKILEVIAEKSGNSIVLPWHSPFHPLGGLSYYQIATCDLAREPSDYRDAESVSPQRNPSIPDINSSKPSVMLLFGSDGFSCADKPNSDDPCQPVSPVMVTVVERTKSCATHLAIFLKPDINEYYMIDRGAGIRTMKLGPGLAESFNFSPNERFNVSIMSCVFSFRTFTRVCGSPVTFELLSDVGAPSRVLNAQMYYGISGQLVVDWDLPDKPRGPIDGFKIEIETDTGSVKPGIETLTLDADCRNTELRDLSNEKWFSVRIAAFNLNHDDRTDEVIGDWLTLTHPDPSYKYAKLVVLVAAGVGAAIWLAWFFLCNK